MTLDTRAQVVLNRLLDGPASTVELQQLPGIVHAPKQVSDLRRAGHAITGRRLPSGVAIYSLGARMGAAIGPGNAGSGTIPSRTAGDLSRPEENLIPAPIRAPAFGDAAAVYALHHKAGRRRRRRR